MTWIRKQRSAYPRRDYDREIFRASLVGLFSNLIAYRRKEAGFTFSMLAEKLGINKSAPSRWFSGEPPNWEANTMADIGNALGVELEIYARDVKTGQRFAPYGVVTPAMLIETRSNDSAPIRPNPFGYQEPMARDSLEPIDGNKVFSEAAA